MQDNTMKNTTRFFGFLVVLLLVGTAMATTLKETFKKRIQFSPGGYIELSNSNGEIEIQSWNQDEVEIIAHKRVRASGAENARKLMERLEINISQRENELHIETKIPNRSGGGGGFFDWIFGGCNSSCAVSYELRVPRKTDLNIGTTNGEIMVKEVTGRIRLNSTNGKITGKEIAGLAKCKTTNGSIKMFFDRVPDEEEMSFRTTNGSIRLYLPRNFGGYADLQTTNGRIDSDFPLHTGRSRSKNRFRGQIQDGDCELTCKTTNGSIYLHYND
jgi:DUF4097 and DUF4098 domain-containing protein YvlB